jgi:plastocyanin
MALAWYDSAATDLAVALPPGTEVVLAHSPPPATGPPAQPTAPPGECQPDGTELTITAPQGAAVNGFDKTCLAAPPGEPFTVAFDNADSTVHNWALFTDPSAATQLGGGTLQEPIQPGQSFTYEVDALDPGEYFYRCDFHPTTMVGTFVVPER